MSTDLHQAAMKFPHLVGCDGLRDARYAMLPVHKLNLLGPTFTLLYFLPLLYSGYVRSLDRAEAAYHPDGNKNSMYQCCLGLLADIVCDPKVGQAKLPYH